MVLAYGLLLVVSVRIGRVVVFGFREDLIGRHIAQHLQKTRETPAKFASIKLT